MAFTKSAVCDTVLGNMRVVILNVTPDATTGTVATGLERIAWADVSVKSGATLPNIAENLDASGAAANGTLAMTSAVANHVYRVVAYGS